MIDVSCFQRYCPLCKNEFKYDIIPASCEQCSDRPDFPIECEKCKIYIDKSYDKFGSELVFINYKDNEFIVDVNYDYSKIIDRKHCFKIYLKKNDVQLFNKENVDSYFIDYFCFNIFEELNKIIENLEFI